MMTAMVFSVAGDSAWKPSPLYIQSASPSEKLSAAKALPRKPASVMPIWMVERKPVGCSTSLRSFAAFLSPSSISFLSFAELSEITAISVIAKKALKSISMS